MDPSDTFLQQLTEHQTQLKGFILASLGHEADSQDVLQRTNLVLWKKAGEFRTDAAFLPWALGVARYEVLAFLRDRQRDHLIFDPDVVELMADAAQQQATELPDRLRALRTCLRQVPKKNLQLLNLRYVHGQSIRQVAEATGRTDDSVKSLLLRIRKRLGQCIEQRLAEQSD